MSLPKLASRLAEKWALHLEFLRASLEHEPSGPQAWRWQIKARVLTYLVARYGNDPKIGVMRPAPSAEVVELQPLRRDPVPPRPSHVFTERLQRITEANDVPPEEQSHLAEDLDRRLQWTDKLNGLSVYLWLLLGAEIGIYTAMLMGTAYSIVFGLAAAGSVWAIGIGGLWLFRHRRKMRRP